MKSTTKIFHTLIVFLLAHIPLYAQYNGGISDGNSQNTLISNVCGTPASFFAYIGGNGDGNSVYTLINAVCGTPPGGFAYLGGSGDGNSQQTITNTTCGLPPGAYAYTGGSGDGQGLSNLLNAVCPTPPQFYAFFGGTGDGAGLGKSVACAIVLPVANFTASPTTVCVNGNVTFTDTSTNAVAWEWTITGATYVNPTTMFSQNPIVKFATAGTYAVTLRALNHDGDDLETKTAYITVGAAATIASTTPASRCGAGSVTLQATSGGIVRWYNAPTAGTLLFTGNSFTTPSISTTTTYYAEAFNGCTASTRTAVVATINSIPTITANSNGRCGAGIVTISATPSSGTVTWYDAATGGTLLSTGTTYTTPSISTTTSYFAETISVEGCTSSRVEVIATVNTTPTITSTTNATICGQGGGTLIATPSAGTINWYYNASGGAPFYSGTNLPVSGASYTFYAEASNNGCISNRVAVVYTYIPNPQITSAVSVNRCGPGSVTLNATADSGTITWYDAATGGNIVTTGTSYITPSLATSTTYYLSALNGTCGSLSRTPITAYIDTTSPPIANANQTFCNSETVGLIPIIPSGPSIIWYDAATGGNVIPNATAIVSGTTYYASQTVNGCESNVRTAVTMTTGGCLGINDFDATYLKVYPNPVTDRLTITNVDNLSKVEVVNLLGQILFTNKLNATETTIDMSRFTSATYLVRIYDSENRIKTIKVMKK